MIKLYKKPWDNRQGYKLVDASGATYDSMAVKSLFNKGKYEIVDEVAEAKSKSKVTRLPTEKFKDDANEPSEVRLFVQAGGARQPSQIMADIERSRKATNKRMAGDKGDVVERLLAEYERELDLESDAIQYASNRRPDLDLLKADGQSYGDVEEQLLQLGQLRGNDTTAVPAPLVDTLANGNELRTHTRYGTNDVTGMQEVRPFIDKETGEALATEFGMLDINPGQAGKGGKDDTASEIVGLSALKLMDEDPAKMNRQRKLVKRYGKERMADMHHYADAKKGDSNVEMMISQRGGRNDNTVAIPTYTNLVPLGNTNMKQEVTKLKNQGLSTEQAVESLIANGKIQDTRETRWGKLGRSDINNVAGDADAVYNELLVSGFPSEQVRSDRDFKSHKLAAAPVSLHMVDLPGMRGAINRGEIDTQTIMTPNRGFDRKGHDRMKVQEIIPQNNQYVTDLTTSHPFTQQLLRSLPVI